MVLKGLRAHLVVGRALQGCDVRTTTALASSFHVSEILHQCHSDSTSLIENLGALIRKGTESSPLNGNDF